MRRVNSRWRQRVLLNAGVRYDEYLDSFGGTLNPRVGLILESCTLHGTEAAVPLSLSRT